MIQEIIKKGRDSEESIGEFLKRKNIADDQVVNIVPMLGASGVVYCIYYKSISKCDVYNAKMR